MKKRQIFCLAGLLTATALPLPVFAEPIEQQAEVQAVYSETELEETVTAVDITWGELGFTYHASKRWNPETHHYDVGAGTWTPGIEAAEPAEDFEEEAEPDLLNKVKVTNHSNTAVTASITAEASEAYRSSLTLEMDKTILTLPSAAAGASLEDPASAPSETAAVTIKGTLPESVIEPTVIGQVTIQID